MNTLSVIRLVALACITTSVYAQIPAALPNGTITLNWPNGKVKEVAQWENGFIIGTRKLYEESGILSEEHIFNKKYLTLENNLPYKSVGKIFTYYKDGKTASIIPVVQTYNAKKEYTLYAYDTITGYDEDNGKRSFTIEIKDSLELTHWTRPYYTKYNHFYLDVLQLYKSRTFEGLNGYMRMYNEAGRLISEGKIVDGEKNEMWVSYFDDGKLKSKGKYLKVPTSFTVQVGKWENYFTNGKIQGEFEFFNGGKNSCGLITGDPVNVSKIYAENGILQLVIQNPVPTDFNQRTDTIERYFPDGKIKYEYRDNIKMQVYNPITSQYMDYKYSGLCKEYNPNGSLRSYGFLSKTPRTKVDADELGGDPCIKNDNKRIGTWYCFDDAGNMTAVKVYNTCGNIKETWSESKVSKENKTYQKEQGQYKFDTILKF